MCHFSFSLLQSQRCWAGGRWGAATLIHFLFPPGALIENFGWPCLFVLVECGGLRFLRLFLSDAAPYTSGWIEWQGVGPDLVWGGTFFLPLSALWPTLQPPTYWPQFAGPLVFTPWFLRSSQIWTGGEAVGQQKWTALVPAWVQGKIFFFFFLINTKWTG